MRNIFITGGTGYIGQHLIPELVARGHTVRALVRKGSERKLSSGAIAVPGNALDRSTFEELVPPSDTFVQLVGVARILRLRKRRSSVRSIWSPCVNRSRPRRARAPSSTSSTSAWPSPRR